MWPRVAEIGAEQSTQWLLGLRVRREVNQYRSGFRGFVGRLPIKGIQVILAQFHPSAKELIRALSRGIGKSYLSPNT